MKRSVAAILIIIIGLSSYLWADNLRRTHGVMFHDGETLIRREQVYQQAPQARIEPYALYYGSSGSLSLLSHLDYIPAEYDQGQCGDCWMWAGTSVMAIALDVNNNIHDRLSVQYLNSNAGVVGLSCCSGGDLPYVEAFYSTAGYQQAIPWSNTNANWQDGDASCNTLGSISTNPDYPITSIQAVTIPTHGLDQSTAIANIKNILDQNKAVYLGFIMPTQADGDNFMNFWEYQSENTNWNPDFSCGHTYSSGWGHAVLCVGYNDTDPNNSYWIVLNSWGVTSGRPNGLFQLDMNMNYDCLYRIDSHHSGYSFDWWTLDITYGPIAGADFTATPTSGAPPLDVSFSDASIGSYTSWSWDFGDGSTSTSRNPVHTYANPGTYTVSLTVSGSSGTFTETKANYILVSLPAIATSPSSLNNSCTKGSNASSQSFQIWNSGAGTLNYSLSIDQSWVSCATTAGISTGVSDKKTITVNYATSGLGPGSYSATITITAPGSSNSPRTILVNLTVFSPAIACSIGSLPVSSTVGCNASSQTFQVWNSGTGTLNYTISSDQPWIACSTSGTSTGVADKKTITASYTTSSLTAGTYTANIAISDPMASNTPITIPVSLTVNPPPPPAIAHNAPSNITASCSQGSSPSSQSFDIWNSGGGTLNFSISTSQTWLSCNPTGGVSTATCAGSGHSVITINYAATNLTPGSYTASITISDPCASNTPQTVPLNLTVSPPPPPPAPPTISYTPTSLAIACVKGSNASSKSITIWNSGGGTLDYSIYTNTAWMSCMPSHGSSNGSRSAVTVSFATSALSAGTYPGILTISAPGATNTPQSIPVNLIVSDPVETVKSIFSMNPTSIVVSCSQGADAPDQSFDLWNSGSGSLNYDISADAAWIIVDPLNGALNGDHAMIVIRLKTSGLAAGEYDKNISITSPDTDVTNSPQTIPVHVSVKAETAAPGGKGGGGCFLSVSVSSGPVPHVTDLFAAAGIMLGAILRLTRIFLGD